MECRELKLVQQNCFVFRGSSSQDGPGISRQRSPGLSLGDIVAVRRYCGSLVAVRFPGKPDRAWQSKRQIGKQQA